MRLSLSQAGPLLAPGLPEDRGVATCLRHAGGNFPTHLEQKVTPACQPEPEARHRAKM